MNAGPELAIAELEDCLADEIPGPPGVFSGSGGAGGHGAEGGAAIGGTGGANSKTSSVTVTRSSVDNSIDAD